MKKKVVPPTIYLPPLRGPFTVPGPVMLKWNIGEEQYPAEESTGVTVSLGETPPVLSYAGQVNIDNWDPVGHFPNGDPWPEWAWLDWYLYSNVFFDDKNQRVDPLTVKRPT